MTRRKRTKGHLQGVHMLSRVANSIYWMTRYIERAENLARIVEVNRHLNLDFPGDVDRQWEPLVWITGDNKLFEERYGDFTEENVTRFLMADPEYPNSILSCLQAARENARSIREIIPSEMWEQINTLYLYMKKMVDGKLAAESPYESYQNIIMKCHLFNGLMESTMSHSEGWHFGKLGQYIERADKISRVLDIKYFFLLPSPTFVGSPFDNIQWAALLKSVSAFEMYRKRWRRISHKHVAEFLILDREFPRAIYYCLIAAGQSLHAIAGTPQGQFANEPERILGRLRSDLDYKKIDEIVDGGLHEFLDHIQIQLNDLSNATFEEFFAIRPVDPHKNAQRVASSQQQSN